MSEEEAKKSWAVSDELIRILEESDATKANCRKCGKTYYDLSGAPFPEPFTCFECEGS